MANQSQENRDIADMNRKLKVFATDFLHLLEQAAQFKDLNNRIPSFYSNVNSRFRNIKFFDESD